MSIYGGNVRAWGGNCGAGIGCGYARNSAKYTNLHAVHIYGGTVEAYGGMAASGIGGGDGAPGGKIMIMGGNVTARHGDCARTGKGIGEGHNGSGGTVRLDWMNITDSISATSYGGSVILYSPFMLQDSTTEATTDNIGGKTIVPPVSVSFNANGGSGTMNSVETAYGYEYTLPECTFTPADGMIFSKWLVGDVEYEPGGSFDVTADTVVKALWKYGSRTVTFNANGHGTAPMSQTVDYGAKLTEPTAPTAEGWTFGGWYKESSCVNRCEFASETVTENRTLYAKWSENAYTISYELDGGINSANNPLSYMTTENFTLTEPTKTGYTFSGWTYDGQTTPTKNVTINGGTGNKTFTAHWTVNQYTITFDTDGGSEVASVTYNYSADVTAPNATPTCKGRIFDGWENLPSKMPAEDITVNAKWKWLYHYEAREATCMEEGIIDCYYGYGHYYKEIQDGDTYTYERIDNQSSVVTPKTSHNYDNPEWTWFINNYSGLWVARLKLTCTKDASHVIQTVTADNEVTSAVTTEPTETTEGVMTYTATITLKADDCDIIQDKTFTDTHTEPIPKTAKIAMIGETGYPSLEAALQAVQGGETITLSDDVEENADVDVGYKSITIDLNGHSATLTSISIQGNLTVKNGTLTCKINNSNTGGDNTLTLDNARLSCEGEYDSDTQLWGRGLEWLAKNIAVTNGSTLSVTGETSLGSGGDDGFSLTIDGTSSIELMSVKFNSYNMTRVSAQLSPYLPEGYSIQIDGESGKLMYNNEEAESVTLYGLSTSETVTVTFDSQGGSAVGSQTLNKGIDKAIRPNDPTRDGYNFGGWQLNGTVYDFSTAVTDNITLTATWTAISYTITYNLDGGTVATANPTSYTIETEMFTLNNPTKNGSTFAGWTGTGLSGATMTVEIAQGSTGARTYTATWMGGGSTPDFTIPTFSEKHSVILEGEIGLKFYVYLPVTEGIDYTNSYMEFDISGDKSNELKYYKADNNRNIDGNMYHYFTCYMSSVQMADKITATFHYGDNLSVSQEYSVKEYLDNILEGNFSTEAKDLMTAIQDYGHFAQPMLSKANGWTIGKEFAEMPASFNDASYNASEIQEARDGVKDYAIVRNTGDSGIEKVEFSLLFDSKTTINVYLTVKSTYAGTVSATFNGTEAQKLSDGRYFVQIRNIPAHELATMYEINVTAGSSFTVKVAALSYVDTMINKTDATIGGVDLQTMKNAVTAFYRYYAKAIAYQNSLTQ